MKYMTFTFIRASKFELFWIVEGPFTGRRSKNQRVGVPKSRVLDFLLLFTLVDFLTVSAREPCLIRIGDRTGPIEEGDGVCASRMRFGARMRANRAS